VQDTAEPRAKAPSPLTVSIIAMSSSSSPKKHSADPASPYVPTSPSSPCPLPVPLRSSSQLFRQAESLLNDIGYHRGKLVPKLLTKTPERYRVDIRAPGPSFVPPLDLASFNPETDSALKIPLRPAKARERPKAAFKEVILTPRKSTNRSSRPPTTHRPSASRSKPLRKDCPFELNSEEKAALRHTSDQQRQHLAASLKLELGKRLAKRNRMGIFSKQVNKLREESMFELAMSEK